MYMYTCTCIRHTAIQPLMWLKIKRSAAAAVKPAAEINGCNLGRYHPPCHAGPYPRAPTDGRVCCAEQRTCRADSEEIGFDRTKQCNHPRDIQDRRLHVLLQTSKSTVTVVGRVWLIQLSCSMILVCGVMCSSDTKIEKQHFIACKPALFGP